MKNEKKNGATTDLSVPNGSRNIPLQSQQSELDGRRHFVHFWRRCHLKYDVTDAILQDTEKMKVQYLRSL